MIPVASSASLPIFAAPEIPSSLDASSLVGACRFDAWPVSFGISMNYPVLFEKIDSPDFPVGCYYVHVPALGLTTHGMGIDGAKAAAADLVRLWIAEKAANGETIAKPADCLLGTLEVSDDALQSA
jgi:predicted RNase H-like HicB family nuclease